MNLFEIVLLDVVLMLFPILIYLIFLFTNKNLNNKKKELYFDLVLITSFFLTFKYGANDYKILPLLVLNSIIILSFLNDKYILANLLSIILVLIYFQSFNYTHVLLFIYVIINILYLLKEKVGNLLFLEIYIIISSAIYVYWIYKYNDMYFSLDIILILLCYIFISNIIYLISEYSKDILNVHIKFKELQKEKQIRLSLFKITHEIKNPIAVCKGYLDMMNTKDLKQVDRYIPIIKTEIQRLLNLLQDFLLINKTNLDLDIMDLNLLIEDTVSKLNPLLKEKNVSVNMNLIDDEIYINGDYNRLNQVLLNLIKNSIEAIPQDRHGNINISAKIINNKYYLTLEDNGEGISKEILSKIKEPFFTTKRRGSGLGVSLSYEIIEAHNGKIEYESEYGKGTRVKIEFPLYE